MAEVNILRRTQFGNEILRKKCKQLSVSEIKSSEIQKLLQDMKHTLSTLRLGVGLAAPQVNVDVAVSVINIEPNRLRPTAQKFFLEIINPEITKCFGRKKQLWEGCISAGPGSAGLFAKVPRFQKIQIKYHDRNGKLHGQTFSGLSAHVIQHEIDHLNGVLFVDRVIDTKTYMTLAEYKKHIALQN